MSSLCMRPFLSGILSSENGTNAHSLQELQTHTPTAAQSRGRCQGMSNPNLNYITKDKL